jgi:hypothetical protein
VTLVGTALGADAVTSLPGTTVAAMAWRSEGRLHITVIAKATFAFVPEAPMARVDPQEMIRAEVHHEHNPGRSVRLTTDFVPGLGRADVLFTGSAYAHGGPTVSRTVRLALFDGRRALLDKRLLIRDRAGFERMPIVYERAGAGLDAQENPVAPFGVEPSIVDPSNPQRPAGLGPISRAWPARRRLLGATPRKALDGPIAEIPPGFDWSYFQAAPPDQRVDFLRGDEWIVLEGLHPRAPILRTRLPEARGHAWIHGLAAFGIPKGQPLALRADMLRIDGDEQRCTVVWRHSFPVAGEAALAAVRIVVRTTLAGEEPEDPPPEPPARVAAPLSGSPARESVAKPPDSTLVLGDAGATLALPSVSTPALPAAPAMPFQAASPGAGGGIPRVAAVDPPPSRPPTDTIAMMGEDWPAAPALPFDEPIEAPTERIRVKPRSEPNVEGPGATLRLDAAEVAAAMRARVAPFPLAAPGEAPGAPTAPIPGAPWTRPAEEPPAVSMLDVMDRPPPVRTIGEMVLLAAAAEPPREITAPPPVPVPVPEPTPAEPAIAPPEAASPPPAPPARSREGVVASLAAGEALSGRDLSGLDLSDLDFTGRVLDGANLRAATLTRAVFCRASLVGANLQRAIGVDVDLGDADLRGADLQKARFCRASFEGAGLRDVLASKADFTQGRFARADLRGASLRGATLKGARFEDAKLDDTDLRNADLEGAVGDGLPPRP